MRKFAILLSLMASVALSAAEKVSDVFVNAPPGIFMLLEKNDRLDMIDYYNSGLANGVKNTLDGSSRITAMTDETMTIAMTPSSVYQLALLPGRNGDVVALIITVSTPARDSRVSFYDAATWEPVEAKSIFPAPSLDEWLTPQGRANRGMVEGLVPFIMASYSYDPATKTLTATNDLKTFLSPEIYDMIKDYMRPSISYTWDGRKFTLVK